MTHTIYTLFKVHLTRDSPPPPQIFSGADVFVVEASQVTEMLEANVIAPYKFRKVSSLDTFVS